MATETDEGTFLYSVGTQVPPGPSRYEEVVNSVGWMANKLAEHLAKLGRSSWSKTKKQGVILTTDFSGAGTAELTTHMIAVRLAAALMRCP